MGRMKRRANGEGTVGQLPDGRWAASQLVRRPDGSYKRIKSEAKTRGQAMARLADKVAKVRGGVGLDGSIPTVGDHLDHWLQYSATPRVRPNTLKSYRWAIEKHITPAIGKIRLDRLTPARLRQWIAELGATLSASSIQVVRIVLRGGLDQAVEDGMIAVNPLTRVKAPRSVATHRTRALTTEQAQAFLDVAKGDRLDVALRLALGLGLRRGEVCGLRWVDVDLDGARLHVRGQITGSTSKNLTWAAPKSSTAMRTLPLPAALVAALRWHKSHQATERVVMGWEPTDYIFTSATDGGILKPSTLYATFKRLAASVGLEGFTLHDLRHSAATFLLADGVSLRRVQAILGHARGTTTMNTYAHLVPGEDDDALDRISQRLESGDTTPETTAKPRGHFQGSG